MGDFGKSTYHSTKKFRRVEPRETGEFTYNCAMNMYHRKIVS